MHWKSSKTYFHRVAKAPSNGGSKITVPKKRHLAAGQTVLSCDFWEQHSWPGSTAGGPKCTGAPGTGHRDNAHSIWNHSVSLLSCIDAIFKKGPNLVNLHLPMSPPEGLGVFSGISVAVSPVTAVSKCFEGKNLSVICHRWWAVTLWVCDRWQIRQIILTYDKLATLI